MSAVRYCACGILMLLSVAVCLPRGASADQPFPRDARRILFLGDSITHAGDYVAWIETQLRLQSAGPVPEIINIGLGSETLSGLSEPGHPFPRPDVHERLDRALVQLKPDVVVACYGMNDGIYHPQSQQRFQAYQQGVNRLIEKVHASGSKLILMTPPPFDPVPLRDKGVLQPAGAGTYGYTAIYEDYDDVLSRYGRWLMQQRERVAMVIDLHTPFDERLAEQRREEPGFTLSPDGIHPNAEGHRLLGDTILRAWGINPLPSPAPEMLALVKQRTGVLHDAWLSEVGHQRPGIAPGLPLEKATAEAQKLNKRIERLAALSR